MNIKVFTYLQNGIARYYCTLHKVALETGTNTIRRDTNHYLFMVSKGFYSLELKLKWYAG